MEGSKSSRESLPSDPSLQHDLKHDFDPNKQFRILLWRGFRRFIMSTILVSLLVTTIWQFGRRQVISKKWKRWFNAINLGLSMALGMSVQKGFKGMAVDLRWWILSRKKRNLSEVPKINLPLWAVYDKYWTMIAGWQDSSVRQSHSSCTATRDKYAEPISKVRYNMLPKHTMTLAGQGHADSGSRWKMIFLCVLWLLINVS